MTPFSIGDECWVGWGIYREKMWTQVLNYAGARNFALTMRALPSFNAVHHRLTLLGLGWKIEKSIIFVRRTIANPIFSSSFSGALFLAFSTYSSWRTSRMGRRRCLTRWSWSTSSRGCVTRWSWSTSSRRCLTSWSWSTSSRGRRWKRPPRW